MRGYRHHVRCSRTFSYDVCHANQKRHVRRSTYILRAINNDSDRRRVANTDRFWLYPGLMHSRRQGKTIRKRSEVASSKSNVHRYTRTYSHEKSKFFVHRRADRFLKLLLQADYHCTIFKVHVLRDVIPSLVSSDIDQRQIPPEKNTSRLNLGILAHALPFVEQTPQ